MRDKRTRKRPLLPQAFFCRELVTLWPTASRVVSGGNVRAPEGSLVASGAGLEPGAPRRRALAQDLRNGHLVMPQSNTICLESWFESLDGLQVVSRLTDKQLWHTDPSVQTMQV